MIKGYFESYVYYGGNAKEAMESYARIFEIDGDDVYNMTAEEVPEGGMDDMGDLEGVIHGSLNFGNSHLMVSDDKPENIIPGNQHYLSWASESLEDTKKVWQRFLDEGAEILMPLEPAFWSPAFGIVRDRFGIQWMIQNFVPNFGE